MLAAFASIISKSTVAANGIDSGGASQERELYYGCDCPSVLSKDTETFIIVVMVIDLFAVFGCVCWILKRRLRELGEKKTGRQPDKENPPEAASGSKDEPTANDDPEV